MDQSFAMPASHHLVVTTTKGVYAWTNQGTVEMFSSMSEGIVAAKKVQSGRQLLAVADSQLVVLHDYTQGMQQAYRLRQEDQVEILGHFFIAHADALQGQIRKLYFDRYSERLFFTTTMQNAVQSYSLRNGCLLDPAPTHPSPPTVFAVSPTSDILLSSSANPPTTYLTNIINNRLPMLLQPSCSASAVIAASFHPDRGNIFALGFADGTVAAFNAASFREEHSQGKRTIYAGNRGEIAHIARLHTPISSIITPSHLPSAFASSFHVSAERLIEYGNGETGNTVVAFVPGFPCTTASVGRDGQCCIVQFQRSGFRGASQIIRTWNISGPATSLSIVQLLTNVHSAQRDGPSEDVGSRSVTQSLILAIGRDDGPVLLHDFHGNLLAMRDFSDSGRVLDLEWLDGPGEDTTTAGYQQSDIGFKQAQDGPQLDSPPQSPVVAIQDISSSPPKIRVKLHVKKEHPNRDTLRPSHFQAETSNSQAKNSDYATPTSTLAFRESSKARKKRVPKRKTYAVQTPRRNSIASVASHSTSTSRRRSSTQKAGNYRTPSIPPRPVPRPGGKLALRRQETAKLKAVAGDRSSQLLSRKSSPEANVEDGSNHFRMNTFHKQLAQRTLSPSSTFIKSTYANKEEKPRSSKRSLSPEELRSAVSNDLNALTGSGLRPILSPSVSHPTEGGIAQDGAPNKSPDHYGTRHLSIAPSMLAPLREAAPVQNKALDPSILLTGPPRTEVTHESNQNDCHRVLRASPKRPDLGPSQPYVSKALATTINSGTAGRQSVTSQSSTSTGTIVDWHNPPPTRRMRPLPGQETRYLSKVAETAVEGSSSKKHSEESAGTPLEWRPQVRVAFTRDSYKPQGVERVDQAIPVKTAQQSAWTSQPSAPFVPATTSPMVSPKTEAKTHFVDPGTAYNDEREQPGVVAAPVEPWPTISMQDAERPPKAPSNKTEKESSPPIPGPPTVPTIHAPVPPASVSTPPCSIQTGRASPRPSQPPAAALTPSASRPYAPTTVSAGPDGDHERTTSSACWQPSLYGRMMSSSEAALAAAVGQDPSLYTLEETIRLECHELREQISAAFEEQRKWIEGILREQHLELRELREENWRLKEDVRKPEGNGV